MPTSLPMFFALAFTATIVSFMLQRHHVLMALLSLEASVLTLAMFISFTYAAPSMELFYCLAILTFGACEASVALAILVFISRAQGSDMMNSFTTNKC